MATDPSAKPDGHLSRFVQCYDHAMSAEMCSRLIAGFDSMPHLQTANGRDQRAGMEDSAWTELNITPFADQAMQGYFYAQIDRHVALYNDALNLTIPVPIRPKLEELRIKRYRAGGQEMFQPHFDAIDYKANRYLVLLWYLNNVEKGGETVFCDIGMTIAPRAGRLLIFPPYWMFQHAGLPPISNDKYIISTYLLF
ncbi:MAG TPA: 2OG-Fe(II) oxygenase [Xanthomonadaceae bacterium]|nr:2OG-Fe(II) oxygenase [Xanthomonadaceae bacterium]